MTDDPVVTTGCCCLFEEDVIVRTDDGCPLHSKRPSLAEVVARAQNSSATDPTWRTNYESDGVS